MDPKWKAGEFCRAVYTQDGLQYEGVIRKVEAGPNGSMTALVEFLGYMNQQSVPLVELLPSKGKDARTKQEEEAKGASTGGAGGEWQVGMACRIVDRDNQLEYEGTLISAEENQDGKYGTVQYVGYGTENTFWFADLLPSHGEEARAAQEADADAHYGQTQAADDVAEATLVGLTKGQQLADLAGAQVNDVTAAPETNGADTTMAVLTRGPNAADLTVVETEGAAAASMTNAADTTMAVLTRGPKDSDLTVLETEGQAAAAPLGNVADATMAVLTNGSRTADTTIAVAIAKKQSSGNAIEKTASESIDNGEGASSEDRTAMLRELTLRQAKIDKLHFVCEKRSEVIKDLISKTEKSNLEKKELIDRIKSLESENAGLRKKMDEQKQVDDLRKKLEVEMSKEGGGRRSRKISSGGATEEIPRTPPSAQRPPLETRTACWPIPMMMPHGAPFPGYPMYPMVYPPYMYPGAPMTPNGNPPLNNSGDH